MESGSRQITRPGGEHSYSINMNVISRVSSMSDVTSRSEGVSPTFPQQLMSVLSDESLNDIITWLPHGLGWKIIDRGRFSTEVLPKYFEKKSKWTSFTRKLNRWKFTRVTRGEEVGAYYHPQFQRGKKNLCAEMSCMGSRSVQNIEPLDPIALGLATPQMIERGLLASSSSMKKRDTKSTNKIPSYKQTNPESSLPTSSTNQVYSGPQQLAHQYRPQPDEYQRYTQQPARSSSDQVRWSPHDTAPSRFDNKQERVRNDRVSSDTARATSMSPKHFFGVHEQNWRPIRHSLSFSLSSSTLDENPQNSRQAGLLHILGKATTQASQTSHADFSVHDLMGASVPSSGAGMSQEDEEQQVSPSIFDTTSSSSESDEKNGAFEAEQQEAKKMPSCQKSDRSTSDSLPNQKTPSSPSGRSQSLHELQQNYMAAAMVHQWDTRAKDKDSSTDQPTRFFPPGGGR